jgi:hypothetical protein
MTVKFPRSQCVRFLAVVKRETEIIPTLQIKFRNVVLETTESLPSVCQRMSYSSVKCAWMLEGTIFNSYCNIR